MTTTTGLIVAAAGIFVLLCLCMLGAMRSPGFHKVMDGQVPTEDEELQTEKWYWAVWLLGIMLVISVVAALASASPK